MKMKESIIKYRIKGGKMENVKKLKKGDKFITFREEAVEVICKIKCGVTGGIKYFGKKLDTGYIDVWEHNEIMKTETLEDNFAD